MNELPLLFSTPMVQATLKGLKTQTRRVITPNNTVGFTVKKKLLDFSEIYPNGRFGVKVRQKNSYLLWRGQCKWQPGDLLYVRETFAQCFDPAGGRIINNVVFRADYKDSHGMYWPSIENDPDDVIWKPSIHMPKEASRIWLRVKDVRVEKVQDISDEDIKAEGLSTNHPGVIGHHQDLLNQWIELWDSINAKRGFGWEKNLPAWVLELEVISTTGRPV